MPPIELVLPFATGALGAKYDPFLLRKHAGDPADQEGLQALEEAAGIVADRGIDRLNDGDIMIGYILGRQRAYDSFGRFESLDGTYGNVAGPRQREITNRTLEHCDREDIAAACKSMEPYLLKRNLIPFPGMFMHLRMLQEWPHPLDLEQLAPEETALLALNGSKEYQLIATIGLDKIGSEFHLLYAPGVVRAERDHFIPSGKTERLLSTIGDYVPVVAQLGAAEKQF
jgi:hypothetical protein